MMRKLALRGRVKGVGGITQQIGEKVRAEREGGAGMCVRCEIDRGLEGWRAEEARYII